MVRAFLVLFLAALSAHAVVVGTLLLSGVIVGAQDAVEPVWAPVVWLLVVALWPLGIAAAWPAREADERRGLRRWLWAASALPLLGALGVAFVLKLGSVVMLVGPLAGWPVALARRRGGARALAVIAGAGLGVLLCWAWVLTLDFNDASGRQAALWLTVLDAGWAAGTAVGWRWSAPPAP